MRLDEGRGVNDRPIGDQREREVRSGVLASLRVEVEALESFVVRREGDKDFLLALLEDDAGAREDEGRMSSAKPEGRTVSLFLHFRGAVKDGLTRSHCRVGSLCLGDEL